MSQKVNVVSAAIATGTAAKTLVQVIAPSDQRLDVMGFNLSLDGTTAGAPRGLWRLLRQTSAGTMSALTPVKGDDSIGDNIRTTAQHTATAEPTAGSVLDNGYVDPMYGVRMAYDKGRIVIGAGDRLGFEVTLSTSVNARLTIYVDE